MSEILPTSSTNIPESSDMILEPSNVDSDRPICRHYVKHGKCPKGKRCNLYHPKVITSIHKKKVKRDPGHCYCGATQKCIISNRTKRLNEDNEIVPNFFMICSKTGKSMKNCM